MSFQNLLLYLTYISPAICIVGVISGLIFLKKLPVFFKALVAFLVLMLAVDITFRALALTIGYNYIFKPYYAFVELCFMIYFYHKFMLSKKYIMLTLLEAAAIMYIVAEIVYYLVVKTSVEQYQSYAKPFDNFIVILLSLTYLYEKTNSFDASRFKYLWFCTIALIYFSVSIFFHLPVNFLLTHNTNFIFVLYGINLTVVVMFYGFITYKIIMQAARPVVKT